MRITLILMLAAMLGGCYSRAMYRGDGEMRPGTGRADHTLHLPAVPLKDGQHTFRFTGVPPGDYYFLLRSQEPIGALPASVRVSWQDGSGREILGGPHAGVRSPRLGRGCT